jgi:YD repeat-containing protein
LSLAGIWLTYNAAQADTTRNAAGVAFTALSANVVSIWGGARETIALAVSGGDRFTETLKSDGTVWTWGWNGFGQLGEGTFTDRSTPVQVVGLSQVIAIASRDYHTLGLKSDGSVWAWGSGGNGELGNNDPTDKNTPVKVLFLEGSLFLPLVVR